MIFASITHACIGPLSNTKDVGRALIPTLANVYFHSPLGIDWETDVRVDGNAEKARVGVDQLALVPNHRIPQDAGIIQVRQVRHII